jgi:hypothetical protein
MSTRWASITFSLTVATFLTACGSTKTADPPIASSSRTTINGASITDEMIGRTRGTMHLARVATDARYGYSESLPIKIGGGFGEGSNRTYQYLNSLRGPHGEAVTYTRVGTCCPFKTPNSPFGGEGILEVYAITYGSGDKPQRIYFDWYDESEPLVPFGLSAAP